MVIANGAKETVAYVLFETPTEVRVKDLKAVTLPATSMVLGKQLPGLHMKNIM